MLWQALTPESVSYNWRGIVVRLNPTNPDVVFVDYPERAQLYKSTKQGEKKRVISCRKDSLRIIEG